ncbi:putative ribosome-binding factor A, mitochondrial [Balaenoptera musculus]|uniref:Ribosome-binding factor A, mitochondrial n=2 Tax=Balaenoptera musculus TaxID=9771 RepID=A0A8B8Z9L7_BALMU|nr:putative ribosome-binding factor A, mitochondrial [Balaenoptera musculus]
MLPRPLVPPIVSRRLRKSPRPTSLQAASRRSVCTFSRPTFPRPTSHRQRHPASRHPVGRRSADMWAALGGAGGLQVGLLLGGARGLHSSPVSCGKNLLKKFASKTKKKFWYEGPSLVSHLTHKPSQWASLTKSTSKRARREDHVRLRALNGLLYKALTELLCTPQVSQELCDLNVELSKVSLTADFSACRVFWRTTVSEARNASMEAVLRRSAGPMRHLLMSQQTLRNMPPIVFVQDKKNAAVVEVDRLLAIADFGPPDEEDFVQDDPSDPEALDTASPCDTLGPAAPSSLCGIDHEALNKQILEYKRRREKGRGSVGPAWLEHTTELMRKRKAKPRVDDDLSPKGCLWETGSDEPLDDGALPEEHGPGYAWGLQGQSGNQRQRERIADPDPRP